MILLHTIGKQQRGLMTLLIYLLYVMSKSVDDLIPVCLYNYYHPRHRLAKTLFTQSLVTIWLRYLVIDRPYILKGFTIVFYVLFYRMHFHI